MAKAAEKKDDAPADGFGLGLELDTAELPQADTRPLWVIDRKNRTAVAYFAGQVDWRFRYRALPVRLQADRLFIHARWGSDADTEAGRGADAKKEEKKKEKNEDKKSDGGGIKVRDFTLYARGNVRVEIPSKSTFFEADSFLYEHATGRGVARGARLKTTYESARALATTFEAKTFVPGPGPRAGEIDIFRLTPLSIHAEELQMLGFERFTGRGIEVSTCDFAVPHFALSAESVQVYPVSPETDPGTGTEAAPGAGTENETGAATGAGLARRDFIIDPESTWFDLWGRHVLPLPVGRWDTRWQTHIPVRSVSLGKSSKFGWFAGADWNLNYFLSLIPASRFLPLEVLDDARLGFETEYLERRGFAWGPNAEYGTRPSRWKPWQLQLEEWEHYGEAQYLAIDDHGRLDRSTRLPPPEEDRFWAHIWHRQSIPYLGLFDVEYSELSDRAYLGEYFEQVAKEEKEQETLAYWRRNIRDNLAVTGLYQFRVNQFQTQTERLPEGKLFLFQQPVFGTGLYTDLIGQAAYLRRLEDEALGGPTRGFGRYDVLNEWAYPLSLGNFLQTRAFGLVRLSEYEEVLDPVAGSEDRAAFGAGMTVSQEWSRIFRFEPESLPRRLFGIPSLKHVIVPKATYLNVFSNDLDPGEVVGIDETDTVDLEESFSLSLRNALYTRAAVSRPARRVEPLLGGRDPPGDDGGRTDLLERVPYETRSLLDSEVSFVLFPQAGRDNGGDRSSLLIFDNTIQLLPGVAVRAWFETDPNRDFRLERADGSVSWEAIPKTLSLTVGDRLTRQRTNFAYGLFNWRIVEKWNLQGYYAHDFETRRDVEYSFILSRLFHRIVFSLEYSQDVGEDRNSTVRFNIMPLELFRPDRHGTRRNW